MITVVAALIFKKDKVLIAKRSTGSKETFGKWEFPGGKVEKNESEKDAIEREILEEFEMQVKAIRFLTNNICTYPSNVIDLRLYECKYIGGDFKLHNHFEYKFVEIKDLLNYDLALADIPLAKFLEEEYNDKNK